MGKPYNTITCGPISFYDPPPTCLIPLQSWGQWKDILRAAKFKKRQLGLYDAESISRIIVSVHYTHHGMKV